MSYKYKIGVNNLSTTISSPSKNIEQACKKPPLLLVLIVGAVIGFINGFWGGGGGMVCVALLVHLLKLPEKKAHASTILVILPLCIASFIIYLTKGGIDFIESWPVMVGFFVGGIGGAVLLKKLNNMVLMIVFAVLIIAGGIKMIL